MGIDPADLRKKNFIKSFPHQTPVIMNYDAGDYDEALGVRVSDAELEEIAGSLGADGAACLWGRPVIAQMTVGADLVTLVRVIHDHDDAFRFLSGYDANGQPVLVRRRRFARLGYLQQRHVSLPRATRPRAEGAGRRTRRRREGLP